MKSKITFIILLWLRPILRLRAVALALRVGLAFAPLMLFLVCAALPLAAQTTADNAERKRDSVQPQEMVQVPAGKFWMGRAYAIFTDSADLVPRDKMDDRPANNIYLDAFSIDKYEVTNADYARFVE